MSDSVLRVDTPLNRSHNHPSVVPVLAGGGSRLSAHIGILSALEELDYRFPALVGVSGGSVVGALFCAGYSLEQLRVIAEETDFRQFLGQGFFRLLRTGGLSSGDLFEQWLDAKLDGKTFSQLSGDFHVVATDLRASKPVVFNRANSSDMKVSLAVRFSMSIPLLFSFKEYKQQLLVDGSILSEEALQRDWAGNGTPVLVFRLSCVQHTPRDAKPPLIPLVSHLSLLIRTFMTTMSQEYISETFWQQTIVVHTGSISPVEFNITPEQKNALFKAGYDTAKRIVPLKVARQQTASSPNPSFAPSTP